MSEPPRYQWYFFPHPRRFPPKWTDWLRLAVVAILLLTGGAVALGGEYVVDRLSCNGLTDADVWETADNECIGLSSGTYAFGLDGFVPVMRVIDQQNRTAADHCDPAGTPVTVGVLMTMSDPRVGGRAVHELEGMAAAQRRANGTGCLHPMKLLVGQIGRYGGENSAAAVARLLADREEVVAVAGIGLSHQHSAEVADLLAGAKVPMVSDLITAAGFDQDGSRGDQPDFAGCDQDSTYPDGIGKDYFYRVAFRNSQQLEQLGDLVPGRPDFIMVPTGGSDPYTCTTLPLIQRRFGGNITEVKFDVQDQVTVDQTANRVCDLPKDVRVAYIARGSDLGTFLYSLDEMYSRGQCEAPSVTVVSTSDGNRMRAAEPDARLEDLRVKALRSDTFASGKVQLFAALVAGADRPQPGNAFAEFTEVFTDAGFDVSHVDAGWAVNAYDSLTTIATALRTLPAGKPVQRSQVNTAIGGFSPNGRSVPGAGGLITFDNSGNRADTKPPVVRLCPLPPSTGDRPGRTTAVLVQPGTPTRC